MNFWIKGDQGNYTHDNLDDLDNDNDETNQLNESLFVVDPLAVKMEVSCPRNLQQTFPPMVSHPMNPIKNE